MYNVWVTVRASLNIVQRKSDYCLFAPIITYTCNEKINI